jgi:hypothetical protein
MRIISRYKWLLLLGFAGLLFALFAFYFQLYQNLTPAPDSTTYWAASRQLYFDGFQAHPLRPYLFPLIIGLPYLVDKASPDFVFYVQCLNFLAWLLTIWAIVKSLLFATNNRFAFIGGLLFATHIGSIGINVHVMTEAIFTCCLAWSAYFCLKNTFNKPQEGNIFKAVGLLTAAALVKPTVLPILFLGVVPLLLWLKIKQKLTLKGLIIGLALIFVPISGQFYNMKRCFGHTTFTYLSSENLYLFLLAYTDLLKETGSYAAASANWGTEREKRQAAIETAVGQGMDRKQAMDNLCQQNLKKALSEHPKLLVMALGRAIISNTKGESYFVDNTQNTLNHAHFSFWQRFFKGLSIFQNVFFSLLAFLNVFVAWMTPRKYLYHRDSYRIVTSLALGIILISGLVFAAGDRFHLTIVPLSIIGLPVLSAVWRFLFFTFCK